MPEICLQWFVGAASGSSSGDGWRALEKERSTFNFGAKIQLYYQPPHPIVTVVTIITTLYTLKCNLHDTAPIGSSCCRLLAII
jgi:hypothetical protein